LVITATGVYTLHLRPDAKTMAALKRGKTLTERVTVVFLPAGAHTGLRQTVTVKVKLAGARK
jgi:VCBS repeat-containing protein